MWSSGRNGLQSPLSQILLTHLLKAESDVELTVLSTAKKSKLSVHCVSI